LIFNNGAEERFYRKALWSLLASIPNFGKLGSLYLTRRRIELLRYKRAAQRCPIVV